MLALFLGALSQLYQSSVDQILDPVGSIFEAVFGLLLDMFKTRQSYSRLEASLKGPPNLTFSSVLSEMLRGDPLCEFLGRFEASQTSASGIELDV